KSLCCRCHNASHAWNALTPSQLLPDLRATRRRPIAPSTLSVRGTVRSSISVSFRADIGGALWQSSWIRARAGAATVVAATEDAKEGGQCCQPPGKQINDLPADGQRKARERMDQAVSR